MLLAIGGWHWVLWGIFFRTMLGLHCHVAGELRDAHVGLAALPDRRRFRNSFWVAHADVRRRLAQQSPRASAVGAHGLAWYEIDMNWYGICALRALGLAWDVKLPEDQEAAEEAAQSHGNAASHARNGGRLRRLNT